MLTLIHWRPCFLYFACNAYPCFNDNDAHTHSLTQNVLEDNESSDGHVYIKMWFAMTGVFGSRVTVSCCHDVWQEGHRVMLPFLACLATQTPCHAGVNVWQHGQAGMSVWQHGHRVTLPCVWQHGHHVTLPWLCLATRSPCHTGVIVWRQGYHVTLPWLARVWLHGHGVALFAVAHRPVWYAKLCEVFRVMWSLSSGALNDVMYN